MKKKMFLLFSHALNTAQKGDAKTSLGVEEFVALPEELQALWSNVPAELESLREYLAPLKAYIIATASKEDVFLIQGDFVACYAMLNFVKELGYEAVASTTKRNAKEEEKDGKIVKTSVFEHVRFRRY